MRNAGDMALGFINQNEEIAAGCLFFQPLELAINESVPKMRLEQDRKRLLTRVQNRFSGSRSDRLIKWTV